MGSPVIILGYLPAQHQAMRRILQESLIPDVVKYRLVAVW